MMTGGLGPKWKKEAICTGLTIWSKSNPATACTQQTGSSLEQVLKGPRASGTMGNVSRLDQLRPLQFHTRCCTGDVLANTQDLYNRFLKATRVQVRSTAALPQWPTKKRVPAILLPMLSAVDTQACLVCLFYIAVPYSPRFIYRSASFTLFSLAWKKIHFLEKLSFYMITMQRNKT